MKVPTFSLEFMLTHPAAFGLETASPIQRAVCRIADGLPLGDVENDPDVVRAIGDISLLTPGVRPLEVLILSGIRTGKSLFAAALAVRAALTCDLSRIRSGETPRVSVLSLTVDLGRVVFDHIVGAVQSKPALRSLLVGEPTADTIILRHPSGKLVEVRVVAGARAGASLVARWSAGCIFDEAPRMTGDDEAVVNYDDARRAVLGRLLPGAQLVAIGSPWAPRGPIYETVREHESRPTSKLVVIRAPAYAVNPVWWTKDRCSALEAQDFQAFRTDVLGQFADPETALVSSAEVDRATRKGPLVLEREHGHTYVAAMDPATRGNAWTLVVACRKRREDGRGYTCIALAKQWQGSKHDPLDPDVVLAEIARICASYGVESTWTDQLAADFVRTIAQRHKLAVVDEPVTALNKVEMFESMRMRLADDGLEIPDDPVVRADLLGVRKKVRINGLSIDLPRTADGRHADYAAAIAIAASKARTEPLGEDLRPEFLSHAWYDMVENVDAQLAQQMPAPDPGDWVRQVKEGAGYEAQEAQFTAERQRVQMIRSGTRGGPGRAA